jgi:23S rRNA (guanine745-N1)-methyltransferase
VADALTDHFTLASTATHRATLKLTGLELRTLIGMTPSARHIPLDDVAKQDTTVTAAVSLTVYRPRQEA